MLTPQELAALQAHADGLGRQGAAERMHVSPGAVAKYMHSVYEKLGAANAAQAVAIGFRRGWLR